MIVWCQGCDTEPIVFHVQAQEGFESTFHRPLCIPCMEPRRPAYSDLGPYVFQEHFPPGEPLFSYESGGVIYTERGGERAPKYTLDSLFRLRDALYGPRILPWKAERTDLFDQDNIIRSEN